MNIHTMSLEALMQWLEQNNCDDFGKFVEVLQAAGDGIKRGENYGQPVDSYVTRLNYVINREKGRLRLRLQAIESTLKGKP